jgi:hypothetical protein
MPLTPGRGQGTAFSHHGGKAMTREGMQTRGWRSPWRLAGWGLAAILLLVPLAAMRVTDEGNWSAADFGFAAVMIGGVGVTFELAVHATRSLAYRAGSALALVTGFLLVWINAAVGIIGDEGNPLNLLYGAVLAVALIGAIAGRFRARGMARAMTGAAIVQALVGGVAVVAAGREPPGAVGQVVLNGIFVLLFAGAALLFARAEDVSTRRPVDR